MIMILTPEWLPTIFSKRCTVSSRPLTSACEVDTIVAIFVKALIMVT